MITLLMHRVLETLHERFPEAVLPPRPEALLDTLVELEEKIQKEKYS